MPVVGRLEPTAKNTGGLEYDVTDAVTDSNVTPVVSPAPPAVKCNVFSWEDYAERGPSLPAKTSSSSLAIWGTNLGPAVGYGVASLFPHAVAEAARSSSAGARRRADVADRVDGPDSTVTTKVFNQRVIGDLERMKLRRKESSRRRSFYSAIKLWSLRCHGPDGRGRGSALGDDGEGGGARVGPIRRRRTG